MRKMSAIDYGIMTDAAKEWKASGKKLLGTICCHIPEEVIHAAGVLPVRIRATGAKDDSIGETYMSPFSCSFARAALQYLADGTYDALSGVVGTNGCMMTQRIYDNAKFIDEKREYHLFTTPRLTHDRALAFYIDEMRILKEKLEEMTGNKITDENLKASVELFNESRRLIKQLYDLRKSETPVITGADTLKWTLAAMSMPKEQFNAELAKFLEEAKNLPPVEEKRARMLLIGSGLDDPEYVKLLEDQGCLIASDVQCFGTRYLWEEIATEGDISANIADMYLRRPICPRMCDTHHGIVDFIVNMAKEYKVDGVIYVRMRNCDPWGGEKMFFADALEKAGLPLLELEREEITTNAGQVAIRTEAFIEMIEERESK